MPSESSEKRGAKANQVAGAPPPEPEQLQCPRCDSKNTKFCYYNNYNFAQPRHFCKSCRRYWTKGGTLRDIPVGGGSRKNAKRPRTLLPNFSYATSAPDYIRRISSPVASHALAPLGVDHAGPTMSPGVSVCKSFTSLLNTQGPGFFALGGFGGGLEEFGYGIGRAIWPFPGVGTGDDAGGSGGAGSVFGNHWYLQGGEGGLANGDCFTLADVSAPRVGSSMK